VEAAAVEGPRFPFRVERVAVTPDLRFVARLTATGVEVRDLRGQSTNQIRTDTPLTTFAAIAPDGRALVSGGGPNGPLTYWDMTSGKGFPLNMPADRVLFASEGRLLLLTREGEGLVWNTRQRAVEKRFELEMPPGLACAVSPDGRTIAIGAVPDRSNDILLADIEGGKRRGVLSGHKQGIHSVAFSEDGKTLASASTDGALIFWNVQTRQELFTLQTQGADSLVFSRSGNLFAFNHRARGAPGIQILRADTHPTLAEGEK
jgi:WD40 repeat protein